MTAVPPHVPVWHVSPVVHASLSSHAVPSAFGGFEQPVAGSQVPASWHWSCAVQTTGSPLTHAPAWHASPVVHASLSSHAVPSGFGGFEQPVAGSQMPASWHWSCAVQTTGVPPTHVPAWHASPVVHASPSSHAVPSSFGGFEQRPVDGSQIPASWHWSCAVQRTTAPPTHVPAWHVSPVVHASLSSHAVPSGL